MAAPPPDDVVLVAWGNVKRVQLAVYLRTYIECLALEGDGPSEDELLRSKKRDEDDVEMVLMSELPVKRSAAGGVRAKAEIPLKSMGTESA